MQNEKLSEFKNKLKGKKVAIIGLGVSNKPLIEYLYNLGCNITVFDKRETEKIDKDILDIVKKLNISSSRGESYLSKLKGFDYIFRSPSVRPDIPELQEEIARGAILTSEIEELINLAPCKIIGVTGSDGKTTTTTLIYEILNQKYNCYLGGNIGTPLFTKIDEMVKDDIIILELSSFQLMTMKKSPNISVITNITPNHLDIHKSYQEYIDAKKNIFKFKGENDLVVLNYDNDITKACSKECPGKYRYFSRLTKLSDGVIYNDDIIKICDNGLRRHVIASKDIIIRGVHNRENISAAVAATMDLVDVETLVKAISNFTGVEHRLEFVREVNGIKWYNDSIASSPNRTIAGLNSYDEKIVLLAGGRDKHLDYESIAKPIIDNVSKLILMGETAEKINGVVVEELKKENKEMPIFRVKTVGEAVLKAYEVAEKRRSGTVFTGQHKFRHVQKFHGKRTKIQRRSKKTLNNIFEPMGT